MLRLRITTLLFCSALFCSAQVTCKVGSYTGDGAATKAITGLGFSPDVVIIKSEAAYAAVIVTSSMTAGKSRLMTSTGATVTTYISSLDAGGFTVKNTNQTNLSGTVYQFVAFNDGGGVKVGSYTGNSDANKDITSVGFQPEMVWLIQDFSSWQNAGMIESISGVTEHNWKDGNPSDGTHISAYLSNGFTAAGTYGAASTYTYHYVAFNEDGTTFDISTYTGNATDNRNLTAALTPVFFLTYYDVTGYLPQFRMSSTSGDKSFSVAAAAAYSDRIQSMSGTTVQLGTNINTNDDTGNYHYIAFGGSVLPVELINFIAVKDGTDVVLDWTTASEKNSENFYVLRSTDGTNFESIASITAAGNSSSISQYNYVDESAPEGTVYYKLKEVDFDGAQQESKVVSINLNSTENTLTQLYPNPSVDNTRIYFNSPKGGMYRLNISDEKGAVVYSALLPAMIGENNFMLPTQNLHSATYFVSISLNDTFKSSLRFVKQ